MKKNQENKKRIQEKEQNINRQKGIRQTRNRWINDMPICIHY